MIANFLAISIFLFLFFYYKKKYHNNILSGALLILYTLTFLASIVYNYLFEYQSVEVLPIVYLIVVLLLWISPFNSITNKKISNLRLTSIQSRKFIYLYVLISMCASVYFSYFTLTSFRLKDFQYARNDIVLYGSILPQNIFSTFFSILSPLYFVNLVFFFIALRENWNKWVISSLLFSSFMFPFETLCFFGRDGVLFWFINFLILFLLFRNQISKKEQGVIKYLIILIGLIFTTIFITISVYRFGEPASLNSYQFGTVGSIIDYLGQQPRNFTESFNSDVRIPGGIFEGTTRLVGKRFGYTLKDDSELILFKAGLMSQDHVFGYFVKALIFNYGKSLTIIISVIFSFLIYIVRNKFFTRRWNFDLIIIIMIYQIPLNGVFYYRQSVGNQDFSYLLLVVVYILMLFLKNWSNVKKTSRNLKVRSIIKWDNQLIKLNKN